MTQNIMNKYYPEKEKPMNSKLQKDSRPSVTLVTLTYGRHKWLTEETIYSFLQQTYENKKLLIINTHKDPIIFDKEYPNIVVVNEEDRFDMLGEKYCFALDLIDTDLWGVLEDDDICLPNHIESLVSCYVKAKSKDPRITCSCNPYRMFLLANKVVEIVRSPIWWCFLFEKPTEDFKLFCKGNSKKGGFDTPIVHYKKHVIALLENTLPTYGYRWETGSRHLSGWGEEREGDLMAMCRKEANEIRNLDIWNPHWDNDYVAELDIFVKKSKEQDLSKETSQL